MLNNLYVAKDICFYEDTETSGTTYYESCKQFIKLWRDDKGELTGNPTATLSSAIRFVPARRLTLPVNRNLLFSLVPKAEPMIQD